MEPRTYTIWSGNTIKTEFMEIEDPLSFSMLCDEIKTHVRSSKKLLLHTTQKHFPRMVMLHNTDSFVPFIVKSIQREMLIDMTEYDVICEGFSDLSSFKEDWKRLNGSAFFSPHERVYRYEVDKFNRDAIDADTLSALIKIAETIYPSDIE